MKVEKSKKMFEEACKYIAGGVSSSVRGPRRDNQPGVHPMFIERASGAHLFDVDGNEFIDYVQAYGAIFLGHAHPKQREAIIRQLEMGSMYGLNTELETKTAKKLVQRVPCAELVVFSNTGSEATSWALKIARAFTGKEKVVKFEGCYHGWLDWCMIDSTFMAHARDPTYEWVGEESVPLLIDKTLIEPGIPKNTIDNIIVLPWNDVEVLERTIERRAFEIAAVILETINSGWILPDKGYLEKIVNLCRENDIVCIFDEIKTGFRLAYGGASEYYGLTPDMATFGKALGNGYPISAVAGRRDIMELVAEYKVSHDGTYNGNPISMAAALANLEELEKVGLYKNLYDKSNRIISAIRDAIEDTGIEAIVQGEPPMSLPVFTDLDRIRTPREIPRKYPHDARKKTFRLELLKRGINARSIWFICVALTDDDVNKTIEAIEPALKETKKKIPFPK